MLRQLLDIARRTRPGKRRKAAWTGDTATTTSATGTALIPEANAASVAADETPDFAGISLPFMIRPADPSDLPGLVEVFRQSVRELAARDYDAAQLDAWAARADEADFLAGLAHGVTILAEHHGEAVGFAQLAPVDHVKMLYVRPDWAGLGIATLLCQYLEDEARIAGSRELTTAASHTARRFFESMGYRVEQEESVRLGAATLDRSLMRKKLCA